MSELIHLRCPTASLVLDTIVGVPAIRYWGAPLPADADLDALVALTSRGISHGQLDTDPPIALVPMHGDGVRVRPGLSGGRRGGRHWAPRFTCASIERIVSDAVDEAVIVARDDVALLELSTRVTLTAYGALVTQVTLTNLHDDERYLLDDLSITLALPERAAELLTFTGRWTRELHPQRVPWTHGTWLAENRRGRTSHEHPPLVWALTPGSGEWQGEVWGVHLAWSANHALRAELTPEGRRCIQVGELLHPGEVSLEPAGSYSTPEVIATYGAGLTPASWAFHRHVRTRSHRAGVDPAGIDRPRPVLLNTWEAVYFRHDTAHLCRLADAAAAVGIERFVLDDGWFGGRRDDHRGLGDWWVSPDVYPDGLGPLIDHVRSLGMEFGIWVEPEMVNPDSDLYRAHPDWALTTDGYEPVLGRHQLVLDLGNDDAFAYVLDQLDALLRDHDIAYVKWDMNRDHVQGSDSRGVAGTHGQTLALYRLLDELRARHPGVEIESCSSGGARIDHEILRRTERVWTSDCNDALERQIIQRGASLFVPPEVMGAHIGPPVSHTTGRRHTLAFRAATAFFGHLGVEWNVLDLDDADRAALAEVIALHRRFRPLLHGGDTVRFDLAPNGPGSTDSTPDAVAHGVYATDRAEALVCFAQLRTGMSLTPAILRLPGLDPDRRYRVELVPLPGSSARGRIAGPGRSAPAWMDDPIEVSGAQLALHGLQPPPMHPETAMLVHLTALG